MTKFKKDRRTSLDADEVDAFRAQAQYDGADVTGLLITGKCPTCEHVTHQVVPVDTVSTSGAAPAAGGGGGLPSVVGETAAIGGAATIELRELRTDDELAADAEPRLGVAVPVSRPILVTCRCASEHDGAKGEFGCGRTWMLRASFTEGVPGAPVTLRGPSPADLAAWAALAAIDERNAGALPALQAAADKWQKAFASLFALVSVVTVVGGRDALNKLDPTWRLWVAGVAIATLASIALSTWYANRASIGGTSIVPVDSGSEMTSMVTDPLTPARSAADDLSVARVFAVLAVVLGLLTAWLFWNANDKPKETPEKPALTQVRVIDADESEYCGELLAAPEPGQLRLRLITGGTKGQTKDFAAGTIKELGAAECMPAASAESDSADTTDTTS